MIFLFFSFLRKFSFDSDKTFIFLDVKKEIKNKEVLFFRKNRLYGFRELCSTFLARKKAISARNRYKRCKIEKAERERERERERGMEVWRLPISATQRGKLISAGYTSLSSLSSISPSDLARGTPSSLLESI